MKPRFLHTLFAAGAVAASLTAAGCGGDPTAPPSGSGPEVAEVLVSPASGFLDPGDSLQLIAVARDSTGRVIAGAELTWRSVSSSATVDQLGRVLGVHPGEVRIEAAARNGVLGSATVRVTPVAAITPDSGRFGQIVTLTGSGFPQAGTVYFSGASGESIPAHIRSASPSAIEVWVPVGARDGPLRLAAAGDSIVTSRTFQVTANEDIHAGAESPVELPVPYENPSLLARSEVPHQFTFELSEPTPFSLVLEDAGDPESGTTVRAWLFRESPGSVTLLGFVMTRDFVGGGEPLDTAVYARSTLPAGRYALLVAALDLDEPEAEGARRPFGIRLETEAIHALAPDAFDPNDFPAEAPLMALPVAAPSLRAENGHAMDHYTFDVAEAGTLTASTTTDDPWILMMLFRDGPVDVMAAWEEDAVIAENDGSTPLGTVEAAVEPGRYHLLVWEWGGRAREYALEIRVAAAASGSVATLAPEANPAPAWTVPPQANPAPTASPAARLRASFPLRALALPGRPIGPGAGSGGWR